MKHRILVVVPPARRERLLRVLTESDVEVISADGVEQAEKELSGSGAYDLVFVDSELQDGSWRDLLQFVFASQRRCEIVVCARCADEQLWAEVIQCGAFDLIPEPMERQEVLRIMNSALESRYLDRFGRVALAGVP